MLRSVRLGGILAAGGFLLVALQTAGEVEAGTCGGIPHRGGCVCTPNAENFGYFPTRWRQWPTEYRPEVAFPQSSGAELLPTPEAGELVPLPKAPPKPYAPEEPGGMEYPGLGPAVPGEGGILPPEPNLDVPSGIQPLPGGEDSLFQLDGGLPGQPSEDGTDMLMPPGAGAIPGFPSVPDVSPPLQEESVPEVPAREPGEPPLSDANTEMPALIPQPFAAGEATPKEPEIPQEPSIVEEPAVAEEPQIPEEPEIVSVAPQRSPARPAPVPPSEPPLLQPPPADPVSPGVAELPVASQQLPVAEEPAPSAPKRPQPRALQANWVGALHPGFRGTPARAPTAHPSTDRTQRASGDTAAKSRPMPVLRESRLEQPASTQARVAQPRVQADRSRLALGGHCPVELARAESWVPGDPRLKVQHDGRTYACANPNNRRRFLADPARYAPACSGYDPVLMVDGSSRVPGKTDYCVTYEQRLYLFHGEATLSKFQLNPRRYTAALASMRSKTQ